MSLSIRLILASALSFAVQAAGIALADDAPRLASIALIDKPWAVRLDITGYRVHVDGVKPDSRRYFLATNDAASLQLSITLEAVTRSTTFPSSNICFPRPATARRINSTSLPVQAKTMSTRTSMWPRPAPRPETTRNCRKC